MTLALILGEESEYRVIFGAIVFLLTVIHIIGSFPLFLSLIAQHRYAQRRLLIVSLVIGVLVSAIWLIYLWEVRDLFIKIALALWMIAYLIFLIQALIMSRRMFRETP